MSTSNVGYQILDKDNVQPYGHCRAASIIRLAATQRRRGRIVNQGTSYSPCHQVYTDDSLMPI